MKKSNRVLAAAALFLLAAVFILLLAVKAEIRKSLRLDTGSGTPGVSVIID